MSSAYLRKLIEERAALTDTITTILDKAATENRDLSADETARIEQLETRSTKLDADIEAIQTRNRSAQKFLTMAGDVDQEDERQERRSADRRQDRTPAPETRSAGQQFIESEQFKAYRGRGSMEPIEFGGFLEKRAAITLDTLGDLVPRHEFDVADPALRTPLLDVIGREAVGSGSIEYITWGEIPVAGGPIAEGAVKPEADIAPEIVPVALQVYAHWKAITRQALEDLPRIRSIVETQLRLGLAKKLEDVAASVINAAAFQSITSADPLAGARQAVAAVQEAGWAPNAILLNPADFAALDIAAAGQANSGPVQFGNYWGLRPVPVSAVPEGTQYVGDFRQAVTWFDRNTTAVYLTDSHADYMIRNLLLILAEQRAAFAATDLTAAVKVTAPAAGGTSQTASK